MKLFKKKKLEEFAFQCPMKCEGDKIYSAPGNCPVCNMRLVEINK